MNDMWIVLFGVSAGWVLSVFTPAVTHRLALGSADAGLSRSARVPRLGSVRG